MRRDSGLARSPLLFVFQDVSDVDRGRALLEDILALRLVENQFHPPHEHHGLVKYDAGGTIVSLNLFTGRRLAHEDSDAMVVHYRTARPEELRLPLCEFGTWHGSLFTDVDGHHYRFEPGTTTSPLTTELRAIRLVVGNLATAIPFYRDVLGLVPLEKSGSVARFATATADILLDEGRLAPDGRPPRYSAYLPVFHAPDVTMAQQALRHRGLTTCSPVGYSDIGATIRFTDPFGHTFCVYQPSTESLSWGSGDTVLKLTAGRPEPERRGT